MANPTPDFIWKKGDNSTPLDLTLKDEDGAVDLTGYTLSFVMTARGASTRLIDSAVTIDADQVTNKGRVTYLPTDPQADLDVGWYEAEVKGTDGSTNPITWPTHWEKDKKWYIVRIEETK